MTPFRNVPLIIIKPDKSMKFNLSIAILINLVWSATLYPQTGYLKINTPYKNLLVSLNDSLIGSSDVVLEAPAGNFHLTITNPDRGYWLFDDFTQVISIAEQETIAVAPVFRRMIAIRTKPYAADVYLDHRFIGSTPQFLMLADTTQGTISLQKEGYHPQLVRLSDIYTESMYVQLEPILEMRQAYIQSITLAQRSLQRQKRFVYAFTAMAIVSGITSAYFHHQSDLTFRDYRRTGDLNKMDRLYDKSITYERVSKVSLGMFQISFALSAYQLIDILQR